MSAKARNKKALNGKRPRKTKFQADLAPVEDRTVERVAPGLLLPRVEIEWTERELVSLAGLISAPEAKPPTEALIDALRG